MKLLEKGASQRFGSERRIDWLFWGFACFFVLLRVGLTSRNEIIAGGYDAEAYVLRAENALWELSAMPMGYPVWLDFSRSFGVPQRLALELLLVLSAVVLAALTGR